MDGKDHQLQRKEAAMATHQQEIQQLRQQLQSSEQAAIGNAASSIDLRWGDDGRAQKLSIPLMDENVPPTY